MRKIAPFLLLAAILLFSNCNQHYFYAPNTLHLPTVKNTGDATIEASLNGSRQITGGELRGAYCFTKNTSAMVNAMYMAGSYTSSGGGITFPPPAPETHKGNGYLVEAALSRHFPISPYSNFVLSAGAGIGQSINDYDRGRTAILKFNRPFLQAGIVSTGELANFGIGLRYSQLNFYKASIDYRIDPEDIENLQRIEKNTPFLVPDLGISAGINFAPVHISCNAVLSITNQNQTYGFTGNNVNVALRYDIFKAKEKTKKKNSKSKKRKK